MSETKKTKIVIVGLGAAGGVLFGKLAEAGFAVVGLEAGPFWDSDKDFVSDERAMEKTKWNDPRISLGDNPLDLGGGTSGKGVGGGTVHYTMMALRLHPSDFRTFSQDGVGVDWPIGYADLEPFYTEIENNLPVSGPEPDKFPWGGRGKDYPMHAHRTACVDSKFAVGCEKLGIKTATCPLALITQPLVGRNACINRGFCEQGCKPKAKSSTLVNYIPRGIKAGGQVIDRSMVTKINLFAKNKVKSVVYIKDGKEFEVACDILILSSFAIETPRLLLANKSEYYPNGLANSSGVVGKYLMSHPDHLVLAVFDELLRPYHNPPAVTLSEDFYETDEQRDFKRGYTLGPYTGRPISFALGAIASNKKLWGKELRNFMHKYNFSFPMGIMGECLPYAHNRVELSAEKDALGLPIPQVTFSLGENEKKMIRHGLDKSREIMRAAGAKDMHEFAVFTHLIGTTRMGDDPQASVVDKNLKTHDLDNLYICGTSVFPTSGAVNPTLTVQALAARLANHLLEKDQLKTAL
ncbi:MAG: GMC family oxidoreductase [Parcubacteria group bacterium]|jgi:choline dehydrogenase-like flavoprotein